MLNVFLSVGAYVGLVAALGVVAAMMARRDGFEDDVRDDEA